MFDSDEHACPLIRVLSLQVFYGFGCSLMAPKSGRPESSATTSPSITADRQRSLPAASTIGW
jgi:hypothetical protein